MSCRQCLQSNTVREVSPPVTHCCCCSPDTGCVHYQGRRARGQMCRFSAPDRRFHQCHVCRLAAPPMHRARFDSQASRIASLRSLFFTALQLDPLSVCLVQLRLTEKYCALSDMLRSCKYAAFHPLPPAPTAAPTSLIPRHPKADCFRTIACRHINTHSSAPALSPPPSRASSEP